MSKTIDQAHPYSKNTILDELLAPKLICFIVNPKAGAQMKSRIKELLDQHLNHRKFTYGIKYTLKPGHGTELAQDAVKEGYKIVVAVGGDGSINEVAKGLIGTDVQLGILPAGSGNGLAMHLGFGRNLSKAISLLNLAKPMPIDIGYLNGQPFLNVAGIGFDGLVSNMMKRSHTRGFVPYLLNSIKAGLTYSPKICKITLPDRTIEERCLAVVVANGPMYGYNFTVAPDAKLADGLFSVVLLKDAPKWQYFAAVPSIVNGKFYEEEFVEHYVAKELSISSEGQNFVHMDGEGFELEDPLNFSILPNAIEVLVPVAYHDQVYAKPTSAV